MSRICKNCAYYGSALFVCFHPENEGIRAFDTTPACKKYTEELSDEQKTELNNFLFNN